MIVARLSDGTFIVGVDETNLQRLREGRVMKVPLTSMGGTSDVFVTYGATLTDVLRELERISGEKLPPPMPFPDSQGNH